MLTDQKLYSTCNLTIFFRMPMFKSAQYTMLKHSVRCAFSAWTSSILDNFAWWTFLSLAIWKERSYTCLFTDTGKVKTFHILRPATKNEWQGRNQWGRGGGAGKSQGVKSAPSDTQKTEGKKMGREKGDE